MSHRSTPVRIDDAYTVNGLVTIATGMRILTTEGFHAYRQGIGRPQIRGVAGHLQEAVMNVTRRILNEVRQPRAGNLHGIARTVSFTAAGACIVRVAIPRSRLRRELGMDKNQTTGPFTGRGLQSVEVVLPAGSYENEARPIAPSAAPPRLRAGAEARA